MEEHISLFHNSHFQRKESINAFQVLLSPQSTPKDYVSHFHTLINPSVVTSSISSNTPTAIKKKRKNKNKNKLEVENTVEQYMLSPEMIEMFKFSENWKKKRNEEEMEEFMKEESEARNLKEKISDHRKLLTSNLYGGKGEKEITMEEMFLDEGFLEWTRRHYAVEWPVVPLRLNCTSI